MSKPLSTPSSPTNFEEADGPELILGIDGRPWGARAVLARAASSVAADASSHDGADGVGEIVDMFEVSDAATLWDRVSDVVARVEDAYGRSSMDVRIASLPGRSHVYEAGKLRRHLADGSTVEVLAVESSFSRRPRENDSRLIKAKADKQSAILAIGVARLQAPGDVIELDERQLGTLTSMTAEEASVEEALVEPASIEADHQAVSSEVVSNEAVGSEGAKSDVHDFDTAPDARTREDAETSVGTSPRVLVAAGAAALVLVGAAGVLGFRPSSEPPPATVPNSVVEQVATTPAPTIISTTVAPTTSTTAVPPTTAPVVSVPADGGPIDLGFLNDDEPAPAAGGPIDLGFLNDDEPAPADGGPIDLGFLNDEPAAEGPVDLSFLPDAE